MAHTPISHQVQYDIQRLITAFGKKYDERTPAEKSLVNSEELYDPLKEIVLQAFDQHTLHLSAIHRIASGSSANIFDALKYHTQLLQEALDIYQKNQAEEVYPTLLNKPISEMTGYQYSVLMSRILAGNTTAKTLVEVEQ